jgi:KDO2-lipid IV(A) lauroyltransferase
VDQRPLPPWRRARRRFYWALTVLLLAVAARVPLAWGRAIGRAVAQSALRLRPRERQLALANLAAAFPGEDGEAIGRRLGESARMLGENLHDTLAARRLLGEPGLVQDREGVVRQVAELAAQGRGVLILAGHLGCWELLGGWLARELDRAGLGPLAVVTGTVRNPAVDRLLQQRRRELGLVPLPRDGGTAPLLRHLEAGGVAAVLLDQNLGVSSVSVPFLGRPAPTPTGPARLVLRRGIPVLPVAIGRSGRGHTVVALEPLRPTADGAASRDPRRVAGTAAWCNAALGELIRRNPAEWVWFHDRWNDQRTEDRK